MGLLDEAIRDHLELKRRRGADASEIARLEHEALGPVRREPFGPAGTESAADEVERGAAYEPATDPGEGEYYEEEYSADTDEGDDWAEPFADDDLRPRHARRGPSEAHPDDELGPPPDTAEPITSEQAAASEETVEYNVDEALAEGRLSRRREADSGPHELEEEGDVLEETPEFLQDAPEHDRLWFEQRPPRDFDFDD